MTVHDRPPIHLEEAEGGALWRLWLSRPPANIIGGAMTSALTEVFVQARAAPGLKAICLHAEGPNFSFGASVEEHLPEHVAEMLDRFHGLFRTMAEASVPTLVALRGHCLGGGLELAAFCNRVVAAPDAQLGQPEIRLGVIAPVASLLLPHRIGRGAAEDLCLSGRSIDVEESLRIGLVDAVAEDPDLAVQEYVREHLLPHSASSLRHAVRAVRTGFLDRFLHDLAEVERSYLVDLMATNDGPEGIRAFLDKRPPQWRNA